MSWNLMFFVNSALLGIGLAMDAFSVSLANGLNEPKMKFGRMSFIAGSYAFFQFAMPMIGWICVHTIITYLTVTYRHIRAHETVLKIIYRLLLEKITN